MAFFTRKGITVPEFPNECVLTEEPEEFNLPSTPSSLANSTPEETIVACTTPAADTTATPSENGDTKRFDYVVDRTYGVEVWTNSHRFDTGNILLFDFSVPDENRLRRDDDCPVWCVLYTWILVTHTWKTARIQAESILSRAHWIIFFTGSLKWKKRARI